MVGAASNGAHALLEYTEYSDTWFSDDSDCDLKYSSLPDANRSTESSKDDCKARCEDNWWCSNFTYYPSGSCTLFNRNDADTAADYRCDSSKGAVSGWYS